MKSKPEKDWSSYQKQLEILHGRGMSIDDEPMAVKYLQNIGYYRLSGYSHVFRCNDGDSFEFKENSNFNDIKELYVFDKKLRMLMIDAIEIIEVSLRSNISYLLGEKDTRAHFNTDLFNLSEDKRNLNNPNWRTTKYNKFRTTVEKNIRDSKREPFIKHHLDNSKDIPIWVALEVCTFGNLSVMYSLLKDDDAKNISKVFNINNPHLFSRLIYSISIIRNVSSHHSRLWNRRFGHSIKNHNIIIDSNLFEGERNFFFFVLAIHYLLKQILPNTDWLERFNKLIEKCLDDTSDNIDNIFLYKNMGINLKGYSSPNKLV